MNQIKSSANLIGAEDLYFRGDMVLISLGIICLSAWLLGNFMDKVKLPRLLAYLIVGIVLGPYVFNNVDPALIDQAGNIRRLALMVILIRAGLSMNLEVIGQVGRPALLMCFLPAVFEILGFALVGPWLLGIRLAEALLLGAVIAAVSPAVLVPRMVSLIDKGYGSKKGIPQMILAGGTMDDILIFVLFAAFMQLNQSGVFSAWSLVQVPVSIIMGLTVGGLLAWFLISYLNQYSLSSNTLFMVTAGLSMLMMGMEEFINQWVPYSGVLAVLICHLLLSRYQNKLVQPLIHRYQSVWTYAEVFLFVFLGVTVNPSYALKAGATLILTMAFALIFRMIGVWLSVASSNLNNEEKLFTMGAYVPKATVQASLGGIPLMMGLACGDLVLTAATLSILITAPLGAIFIDRFGEKMLREDRA